MIVNCDYCGKPTYKKPSHIKRRQNLFCSTKCSAKFQSENRTRENNNHWKGGKWFHGASGYIYCSTERGMDIPEQRLIAGRVLDRKLKRSEIVHHINGDKTDNRNENLLICDKSYHHWLHNRMATLYMKEHFNRRLDEQSSSDNSLNSGKPKSYRYGNPEPSPIWEGVETVQGVPLMGKETVQATNDNR